MCAHYTVSCVELCIHKHIFIQVAAFQYLLSVKNLFFLQLFVVWHITSLVSVRSGFKGGESSESLLRSSNQMANSQLHKKSAPRIVAGHPANKM